MLIRYPGSKDKHIKFLETHLLNMDLGNGVCEPFAGTASITFYLLKKGLVPSYWINDADKSITSLWKIVRNRPNKLIDAISEYIPKVDDFYEFKSHPGRGQFDQAFRKIVLHQVSYSGLGPKAGGPLGGRSQRGLYRVNNRWNPDQLNNKILECSNLLNSVPGDITNLDWKTCLRDASKKKQLLYLDPPYFEEGPVLYSFGQIDHQDLAKSLRRSSNWMLSYDDVPTIRNLYHWAKIRKIEIVSHIHHKAISDVLITSG